MFWMSQLERIHQAPASFRRFLRRLGLNFLVTVGIVAFSLTFGTLGYHYIADFEWVDAFLNSSMILTGMGPAHIPRQDSGKLFAAFYALYSGLAFLIMVAVLLTPVCHRFIHQFHLQTEHDLDEDDDPKPPEPPLPLNPPA